MFNQRWWVRILEWFKKQDFDEGATLMVFGALVGVVSGLGVIAFYGLIDVSHYIFIRWPEDRLPRYAHVIYLPLLTGLGVLAAWLVVRRAGIPDGQNVPDVQLAVAKRDGTIRTYPVVVRAIASAFTLGSGGSAGSEGPVAVLGSTLGSALGRRLRLHPRHTKILVGCGAAAGIAGAFNAPFAGAFFALEEVLGSFSVGAFSPVVIASVVGALTVRPVLGDHPIFRMPSAPDTHVIASALLYPVLGVVCGLVSALYARLYLAAPRLVGGLPGPPWLRPLAGGGLTGLIVLGSGGLLAGNGHLAIPGQVFGELAWYALIALALAKILATVVTLGSGGSGGVFTPTLFIGAALGGGLGVLGAMVVRGGLIDPQAWALVGMAGMVAGATRAPLTAIFMVFEMTDDYSYVVPLMIVAVIAYATARRFAPHGLYDGWLAARGEHLAHGADQAIMERLNVRAVIDGAARTVRPDATVDDVIQAASESRHGVIPVVEADGALVGMVTHHSLRAAIIARGDLARLFLAEDLAEPVEVLRPEESLRSALAAMNTRGMDALPVVDGRAELRFLGLLTRADILIAYERELSNAV
jgi:CIC family chloride channel protein